MDPYSQQGLSSGQKTGFVLLLVFALLVVAIGMLQLRNTIYGPFAIKMSSEELQAKEALQFDELTRQQQIDTDHDGINDYEELNFYNTSPYLSDTDSDGIDDDVEIEGDTDPLCPKGTTCVSEVLPNASSTSPVSPLLDNVATASEILHESQTGLNTSIGTSQETNNVDIATLSALLENPEQVRQLLLSTGQISAEELAKIPDETLISLVTEMIQNGGATIPTTTTSQ